MNTSENPFASPRMTDEVVAVEGGRIAEAEQIRRKHLNHETSLRSVGLLYYFSIVALLVVAAPTAVNLARRFDVSPGARYGFFAGFAAVWMVLIGIQFFVGRGLRTLDPRVRIPVTILSVLGLLQIGLGTLINAYVLYLVWSRKGKVVFSPEYKQIMRDTPHIKYKTSIIVWIAVGLLVFVVGLGILAAIFGR